MATFIPGGGTLKSTTLEGAFFEAVMLLLSKEKDTTLNVSNLSRVSFTIDQGLIATGSCTFSAQENLSATDDSVSWNVSNYLGSGFVFSPGSGGTLKATNLPAAIVALAKRMQNLESQTSKNSKGLNNIAITYDSDLLTVRVNWQCQLDLATNANGRAETIVKTYLVD